MSFEQFKAQSNPIFDEYLRGLLNEKYLDSRSVLQEAIRYSLMAPSKRLRPILIMMVFSLFSKDFKPVLPVAAAIEIFHTYTLIHDDLPSFDNDDYRRGQISCHKKYGESMAILAGDVMNTYCFELVSSGLRPFFSAETILDVIQAMAKSFGFDGVCGGQCLDMSGNIKKEDSSLENLIKMHQLKTGALLEVCVELPLILSNVSDVQFTLLKSFARHLGLLYQVVDDILDVVSTSEDLGKTIGKDEDQDKLTFVSLLGLEKAIDFAKMEADKACKNLAKIDNIDTSLLRDLTLFVLRRVEVYA